MPDKKKVAGVVDRVEGDIAVIVVKDPKDGINKEIYVDKKKLKKVDLKEGDPVTVEMSVMVAEVDTVNLTFAGLKSGEMAKRFFTYLVDGGLEDHLIQALSGKGVTLEISGCDTKTLTVNFQCSKEQSAKKAGKPPVKKTVTKAPARRPKKG